MPDTVAGSPYSPPPRAVLITGGAKRLGKAIALHLAELGWDIALHYGHSETQAQETQQQIKALGVNCVLFQADLADANACTQLIQDAKEAFPHLGDLVNNASVFEHDRARDSSLESWQKHLDTNLRAPFLLAQNLFQALTPSQTGCVVNLIDQKVYNLNPDFFSYTISKIGLEGLTKMLALEFAPKLRVCGLALGMTLESYLTSPQQFSKLQRLRLTPASDSQRDVDNVVRGVSFLLHNTSMTGSTMLIDYGQHLMKFERDFSFLSA